MTSRRRRPNRSRIRSARLREKYYQLYPDKESLTKACSQHIFKFWSQNVPKFHPDYGAQNEILHLVTLCRQYVKKVKPRKYDIIMVYGSYILTWLCYSWQVKNSKLVSQCLQYLYQYGRLFHGMSKLLRSALPHPRGSAFNNTPLPTVKVKGLSPISYFSQHASKTKALFNGIPFVDLRIRLYRGNYPSLLYYAAVNRNPIAVKALLRCGATITPAPGKPQWVASLVLKLIGKAVKLGVLEDAEKMDVDGERMEERGWKELECVNALLQAMPPMSLRHIRFRANDHWKSRFIDSEDFVATMSDRRFVPRLKSCFLLEPVALKHMCRVVVRERLQKNRELPFGIGKLEVPRELKAYLNLEGQE